MQSSIAANRDRTICSQRPESLGFFLPSFLSTLISSNHQNVSVHARFRVYFPPNAVEPVTLLVNARSG
jgi:hypothetical protein